MSLAFPEDPVNANRSESRTRRRRAFWARDDGSAPWAEVTVQRDASRSLRAPGFRVFCDKRGYGHDGGHDDDGDDGGDDADADDEDGDAAADGGAHDDDGFVP